MEGVLGMPAFDDEGLVVAFATDIRLVLRQKDQEHLEELDGLRKAAGTWESRRQHERNIREYLGDDVLQSPGRAVVWWMARHDDQIERAVEMIAPLAVLSAVANDEEIPEEYRDLFQASGSSTDKDSTRGFDHPAPIGEETAQSGDPHRPTAEQQPITSDQLYRWMESMGIDEGSVEGATFLHRLAQMSDAAGRPEAAENIRRRMRREGQKGSPTAAAPFGDCPPDLPSPAGNAYTPPPYEGGPEGHRTDEAQPPRAESWQVPPEGLVFATDKTNWSGPDGPRLDDPGPDREGDER